MNSRTSLAATLGRIQIIVIGVLAALVIYQHNHIVTIEARLKSQLAREQIEFYKSIWASDQAAMAAGKSKSGKVPDPKQMHGRK